MRSNKSEPSLKSRAVAFLSRREHSRLELQKKLSRYSEDINEINATLDDLQAGNWQSDARYAHAYARCHAEKHGLMRILNHLRQQDINESILTEIQTNFRQSEFSRTLAVWEKRFGVLPENQKEYAKQYRFLLARGFPNEIIRKILSGKTSS